jgi:hypothetical protein
MVMKQRTFYFPVLEKYDIWLLFQPVVAKLGTSWNGLDSSWLKCFFFKYFFGKRLRRNGV